MRQVLGTHQRFLIKFPLWVGRIPDVPHAICPSRHHITSGNIWMCTEESSFPCGNCNKMLAMRHMLRDHKKGCVSGTKYQCSQCDEEYSTKQGHHQ